jgi:membrane protein implicated in regulation of membrane protease activity
VRVAGEIWLARSTSELAAGARVKVRGREGLTLVVDRV